MPMRFDFDYQKTYTTDNILGVGTTTELYKRGSLPEPLPDDLNSIWVAPNGSNSNAGTQAAPVLTIANALTKMGGAKLTCHIFRNGYVGDLVFDETVSLAFLATYNLQVEDGEKATITLDNSNQVTFAGTNLISGIRFEKSVTPGTLVSINTGNGIEFSFCDFISPGILGTTGFGISAGNTLNNPQVSVRNCYFYCFGCMTVVLTGQGIYNNLFVHNRGTYTGSQNGIALTYAVNNNALTTNRCSNNYFVGFSGSDIDSAINYSFVAQPLAPGHTTNIESCLFLDCNNTYISNTGSGGLDRNVVNQNNCLDLSANFINLLSTPTLPANTVFNINDPIDTTTPLMLINQKDLLANGTLQSSELQYEGKSTPDLSGKYFLDSPLTNIGRITDGLLLYAIFGTPFDPAITSLQGVDVVPNGTLLAVGFIRDRIYNIQRNGDAISEFNTTTLVGAATSPTCVTYNTTTNTVFFACTTTRKVYETQLAGSSIINSWNFTVFSASETAIQGISYDPTDNTFWLMGDFNDTVYHVNPDFTLITSFLVSTFDPGETSPRGIAVAPDGTLYASGFTNDNISHIERDGTLIAQFPSTNYDSASTQPNDLCVDKNGYLFISEQSSDRLNYVIPDINIALSPFTELTELTSEGFNEFIDINWPPTSYQETEQFINAVNENDVNGNLRMGYDTIRRLYSFTYGTDTHISNVLIKEILFLLATKGTKKFQPLGLAGNLFDVDAGSSAGTFSNTDNSVAPTDAATVNMVNYNWRGHWITIGSNDYYIASNDATKLYLEDRLGVGFPSNGAITFVISYILVNNLAEAYVKTQSFFKYNTENGQWREDSTEVRPYDLTIDGMSFQEVEDLEENE